MSTTPPSETTRSRIQELRARKRARAAVPKSQPRRRSWQARQGSEPRVDWVPPHIEHQEQSVGVELRPVSGLFGKQDAIELTARDKEAVRHARRVRRERTGTRDQALLKNPHFRLLWLSRLCSQTAQGALMYALMILVIDLSARSFAVSLFVACANVASMGLGLPAGMVVDAFSRRFMLTMLNGFRFAFMLAMVTIEPTLGAVFACTIGIWIIHQFYSPAEASLVADLVPTARYTEAQSLHNLALTISQGVGLIALAPLALLFGGAQLVFVLAGTLWLMAGAFTLLLPSIPIHSSATKGKRRRSFLETLTAGLQFIRRDRVTLEAILHDVLVSVGMSALVVIIPFYLERVLNTSKENTVFVFAPAAIGLLIGLRLAPVVARMIGERRAAFGAVIVFGVCIFALGFIEQSYWLLNDVLRLPLDQITDFIKISPVVLLTMIVTIPAGMAMSIVNVASRSILLHRTPGHVRGQVIASQGLIGNIIGLVPTLLAGLATDLFGVVPVAVALAVLIILGGVMARHLGNTRRDDPEGVALAPA
jgi:MFS family permease